MNPRLRGKLFKTFGVYCINYQKGCYGRGSYEPSRDKQATRGAVIRVMLRDGWTETKRNVWMCPKCSREANSGGSGQAGEAGKEQDNG